MSSAQDGVPPIPKLMLDAAAVEGLDERAIVKRWRQYTDWHSKTLGTQEYRMTDWERHINWELADAPQPTDAELLGASRLKARELEEAVAKELYDREACSFGQRVKLLEARERGEGEPLSVVDQAFLNWRRTLAPGDPRAWGLTALRAFGEEHPCACVGGALQCGHRNERPRIKVNRPSPARARDQEPRPLARGEVTDLGEFARGLGLGGTGT